MMNHIVPKLQGFGNTNGTGDIQGPSMEDGSFNPPANNGDPFIDDAPSSTDPFDSDSEILYFLSKEKKALIFIAIIIALMIALYLYLK